MATRKYWVAAAIVVGGVVVSLPFWRNAVPGGQRVETSPDNALTWRQRPANVLLDIGAEHNSAPSIPKDNPIDARNAHTPPGELKRGVVKGPVRLQNTRVPPVLPDHYRPLIEPGLGANPRKTQSPTELLTESPAQQTLTDHKNRRSDQVEFGPQRYTIRDGDTLPGLAERFLGDRSRHNEILDANRDVLSSPDGLPIGVEITIPFR